MAVESLGLERERRNQEISSIQRQNISDNIEISRLSREADEMYRWAQGQNSDAYNEAGSLADGSDLIRYANQYAERVRDREGTIRGLEDEIAAIHEVLSAKLREVDFGYSSQRRMVTPNSTLQPVRPERRLSVC